MAFGNCVAGLVLWAVAGMAMAVPATNAELKKQVADTEPAFAATMLVAEIRGQTSSRGQTLA